MAVFTSVCSNWADDIPADLLQVILSKLFGKDRHSFSLVCRSWNTVATTSPYRYSPCLLMYYCRRSSTCKFYQYNTFSHTSFPELENAELRCSKYGWLLMSGYDNTLFFIDPTDNHKVKLPCKVGDLYTSLCFFNPPTSRECVVLGIKTLICKSVVEICILKRGEDEWRSMKYPSTNIEDNAFWMSLAAPVLHGGLIYLLGVEGMVATLDIQHGRFDVHFNCLRLESDMVIVEQYLVKVNGEEDLFGVFVFEEERKVNVFRLSSEMKWGLVDGIGDKVLYLSHISSFGYKATTKSMENTICFPMFHGDVGVFYSLSDAKYHSLDEDYSESNAYGLKRLDLAAWLMPMPVQELIPTTSLSWL